MNTERWLALLRESVDAFNQYRAGHPDAAVSLFEADLSFSNLQHVNLEGADLRRCRLEGCNLSGARLDGAQMELANLRAATLTGASLRGVTLFSGTFQGGFAGHVVPWANLKKVSSRCGLSGASVHGANSARPISGANDELDELSRRGSQRSQSDAPALKVPRGLRHREIHFGFGPVPRVSVFRGIEERITSGRCRLYTPAAARKQLAMARPRPSTCDGRRRLERLRRE